MSKVLVIGGGFGGAAAIVGLRKVNKDANITLVEPKDHAETAWAAYRSPFDEKVAKASLSPLAPFCETNNVKHLKTIVKSLTLQQAELENGETVEFDVCVVAVGATTKWPGLGRGPHAGDGTVEGRLKLSKDEGEKLISAGSVLVVGGGLIGTEVAGDLAGYAKKAGKPMSVTLVHSGDHLCPEMSDNAAAMTKHQLEKNGVKVLLNERATLNEDSGKWTLKSGETIQAKEVVMTTGFNACNDFMKNGGLETSLNERGWVDTDETFLVKGTGGKIFSIGDCCTTLPNSGAQVLENIKIIGHNINVTLKAIQKKESLGTMQTLKEKKMGPEIYLATTGPSSGVMFSSAMTTKRFFPWIKNKTMFFFRVKSELGLTPAA